MKKLFVALLLGLLAWQVVPALADVSTTKEVENPD